MTDEETRVQTRLECQSELRTVQNIVGEELRPEDEKHLDMLIERIVDDAPNYQLLEDVLGRFGTTLVEEYGYSPGSEVITAIGTAQEKLNSLLRDEQAWG